jgi:cold shock protein
MPLWRNRLHHKDLNRMSQKTGTVKFFNATKGFGFISPEGGAGWRSLNEGQRVAFDTEADARGPKAINLRAA